MDLLSFLAKLIMDSTDYNDKLDEAQKKADDFKGVPEQKLEVDKKEYTESLKEAEGEASVFQQVLTGAWQGIKDALTVTGISAAIGKIVKEMGKAVSLSLKLSDDIDKGSKRLNISAEAYQEWGHALDQSGADINDFQRGILNINKLLSGGDITEKARDAFVKLGMVIKKEVKDADGKVNEIFELDPNAPKDTENFLKKTVKALADFGGTDEERGTLANAIFGNNAGSLNALFEEGSSGIQELIDEAHELGLVLSDEQIEKNVKLGDSIENLKSSIEQIKVSLVQGLVDPLQNAVETVMKIIVFFNGGNQSLAEKLAGGDKELEESLLTIEGTSAAAQTLADKLIEMGNTAEMTADEYAIWKGTAEELINLVPKLSEVINTETGEIKGGTEALKANIKEWENLAKQKAIQSIKEKKYQEIVAANEDVINATIEANNKAGKAAEARVNAYQAFSKEMESRGYGKLDMNGDVDQQISDLMTKLAEMGDEGEADALALGAKLKSIGDANLDLAKAEQAAADLQKQLDEGMAAYEEWVAGLDAIYGTTSTDAQQATADAAALKEVIDSIPDYKRITLKEERMGSFAIGSNYIPYDMPAMLHRGERVLTATENRKGEGGGSPDLSHLEDRIAAAIRAGMEGVSVNSYLNGRAVTEEVNRNNMRDVKGRRFSR